jgi:uncharacterized membrane protein HdeD (DUF308 family)
MDDGRQSTAEPVSMVGRYWWLWLVAGIVWIIVGFVILQFDDSSIRAVGIIIGVMFLIAGLQYVVVGTQAEGWNWLWYIFGGFLIVGGLVAMFNPERTFVAIANIIGFIFLMIGIIWIIEAFATKTYNDLWWLTLITGILMIALAFWLGNQFFFDKAATLLVFAGVWALMRGIIDIIGAFQVKKMGKIATDLGDQMAVG